MHPASLFGAAVGAGLAYAFFGQDIVSLGAGAGAGYFAYPIAQSNAVGLPVPYARYVLPAASGAAIAYGMYGQNYTTLAAGAAAGAGAWYVAVPPGHHSARASPMLAQAL